MAKADKIQNMNDADDVSDGSESVNNVQEDTHSAHGGNEHENHQSDDETSHQSEEDEPTIKKTTPPKTQEPTVKRNKNGSVRKARTPAKSKGQIEKKTPVKRKGKANDTSASTTSKRPRVSGGSAKKNAVQASSDNEEDASVQEQKRKEQEEVKAAENKMLSKLPWYREEIQKYFTFIMNRSFKWEDIPKDLKLEHRSGPVIKKELMRSIEFVISCYPKRADLIAIHTGEIVPAVETVEQNNTANTTDEPAKNETTAVESPPDIHMAAEH